MQEFEGEVGPGKRNILFTREPEGDSAAEEITKRGGQHQGHPDTFPSNKETC